MSPRLHLRILLVILIILALLGVSFALAMQFSEAWELGDFRVTYYRVAQFLLRGENVYLNSYPHPYNGREYPPYVPIWSLYVYVPLGTWTLPVAEALRVVLDIIIIPLLAYLAFRWARLTHRSTIILLVLAPWLLTQVHSGQLSPLILLGTFLCYWGVRKPSAWITAVGLWLLLVKFTLGTLILLATFLFAWRKRILVQSIGILLGLIVVSSLASPLWFIDLGLLYVDRLIHPRVSDSILLFPGYPWGQVGLLIVGMLFLVLYVRYYDLMQPSPWLWAMMLGTSLVGALHTFIYDWQLLMPLLALLLRSRWGRWFTLGIYVYALSWVFLVEDFKLPVPSLKVVPGLVLMMTFFWGIVQQRFGELDNESTTG